MYTQALNAPQERDVVLEDADRSARFEARVAAEERIEPNDWMPAAYRKTLTRQIEADIGERHVLFQHRRVAAPLRQPVSQNQRVVGAAQRVQHQRRFVDRDRGDSHHICPTSSGTS